MAAKKASVNKRALARAEGALKVARSVDSGSPASCVVLASREWNKAIQVARRETAKLSAMAKASTRAATGPRKSTAPKAKPARKGTSTKAKRRPLLLIAVAFLIGCACPTDDPEKYEACVSMRLGAFSAGMDVAMDGVDKALEAKTKIEESEETP